MSKEITSFPTRQRMNWLTTIVFGIFHVGAIAALFMFSWKVLAVSLFLYWMCIGLGISLGYHRYIPTARLKYRWPWNIFLPFVEL